MPMNAILPTVFNDSVALRASNLRFRGVGNPYAFLDEIGIIPIKEFLYRGANIIELAEALNLPLTTIHTWIEQNNYQPELEEASVISAEGYIWRGESLLKTAENKFQLDKAKIMLEHGRFMASKKNKKVYGNTQDVGSGQAAVSYTFNIGGSVPEVQDMRPVLEALDVEYTRVTDPPKISLDLEDGFTDFNLGSPPEHIAKNIVEAAKLRAAQTKAGEPVTQEVRETYKEQDHWNT